MGDFVPDTAEKILQRNERAKQYYAGAIIHMDTVEEVWRGEWPMPRVIQDMNPDLKKITPSLPHALLKKVEESVGLRSEVRYDVARQGNSDAEQDKAEQAERILRAFFREHRRVKGEDVFRAANFLALLRGRAGWHITYDPERQNMPVRVNVLDGRDYFSIKGENGVMWYTAERLLTGPELTDFIEALPEDQRSSAAGARALIEKQAREEDRTITLWRVVEYWDDEYMAWCLEDRLMAYKRHDYGFLPLTEIEYGRTPIRDPRWATTPYLGPILDDVKALGALTSMMATGVDLFFFPLLYSQSEDGGILRVNTFAPPGEIQYAAPGAKLETVNPQVNHNALQQLSDTLRKNIERNTLPEGVFELPPGSGFSQSIMLNAMLDSVADFRDALEVSMGWLCGQVLELLEKVSGDVEIMLPLTDQRGGRERLTRITPDMIDGHYTVNVSIKPSLPQDRVQAATIFQQLIARDPGTGKQNIDPRTAMEISGLSDMIEDSSAMRRNLEWQFLSENDEESKLLYVERIKADYAKELEDMRAEVARANRRKRKRDLRKRQREIEQGVSEDIIIPADKAMDAEAWHQAASLIERGMDPLQAFEDSTLGAPQQNAGPAPDVNSVLDMAYGPQAQMAGGKAVPDGLTGYEGVNPQAMPPEMQGMQPRQQVDKPNLEVEQIMTQLRRGAKPPAK